MHDRVYATDKFIHTYDLLQVLLSKLQHFEDVETKEIVPLIRYNFTIKFLSKENLSPLINHNNIECSYNHTVCKCYARHMYV